MGVDLCHGGNRQAVAEVLGCRQSQLLDAVLLVPWMPVSVWPRLPFVITLIEIRPLCGLRSLQYMGCLLIGCFRVMVLLSCLPGLLVMPPLLD